MSCLDPGGPVHVPTKTSKSAHTLQDTDTLISKSYTPLYNPGVHCIVHQFALPPPVFSMRCSISIGVAPNPVPKGPCSYIVYLGIQKAEKSRPYGKSRFLVIKGRILGFKWFLGICRPAIFAVEMGSEACSTL